MAFLSSMNVIGSGLTAQQMRLDIISENITNMQTTRTPEGGAYRRKMVVFEADQGRTQFRDVLGQTLAQQGGVRVSEIVEDPSDFKLVYDPAHPDANEQGFVEMPNVDLVKETTDAMAASHAYSANVTALNVLKSVIAKGLEIGK